MLNDIAKIGNNPLIGKIKPKHEKILDKPSNTLLGIVRLKSGKILKILIMGNNKNFRINSVITV